MKYESSILKRLVETYGVVGNPRYISEVIKEFIVQGKERFPELFTYQADWLAHIDEFGLNPTYTVSYTGQSIYAPNTLERPVKSAILSGNTLVNLCDKTKSVYSADGNKNLWQNVLFNTNPTQLTVINHTDKVIKFTLHNRTTDNWVSTNRVEANSKSLVNCGTNNYLKDLYGAYSDGWSNAEEDINILKDGVLILEGDHTQEDIPYFEGMQSVKMPVLRATGKNLFDVDNILYSTWVDSSDPNRVGNGNTRNTLNFTKVKPNQKIIASGLRITGAYGYDVHKKFIESISNIITTTGVIISPNVYYVRLTFDNTVDFSNAQLEYDTPTPYEPYKSNILTVNEPVELRGIGDVQDELNLMTGELTQRIGVVVLDGNAGWSEYNGNYFVSVPGVQAAEKLPWGKATILSNLYPSFIGEETDVYIASGWNGNQIKIRDVNLSLEELKSKLMTQPLVATYISNEESVKTVDLTILDQNGQNVKQLMSFNGGTHFNTRSSEGSPLPTVSVSVETDLEETLKMCSLDGNTM